MYSSLYLSNIKIVLRLCSAWHVELASELRNQYQYSASIYCILDIDRQQTIDDGSEKNIFTEGFLPYNE